MRTPLFNATQAPNAPVYGARVRPKLLASPGPFVTHQRPNPNQAHATPPSDSHWHAGHDVVWVQCFPPTPNLIAPMRRANCQLPESKIYNHPNAHQTAEMAPARAIIEQRHTTRIRSHSFPLVRQAGLNVLHAQASHAKCGLTCATRRRLDPSALDSGVIGPNWFFSVYGDRSVLAEA